MKSEDHEPGGKAEESPEVGTAGSPDAGTVGIIFGLLYRASHRSVLGISVLAWLKLLLLATMLLTWLLRWPLFWFGLAFLFLVTVQISSWVARRAGYIVFRPPAGSAEPTNGPRLAVDRRLRSWASGPFSLSHEEMQVVARPAEVWRGPNEELNVMVRRRSGGYAYQFIRPDAVEVIRTGQLQHGRWQRPALAITFHSTWGPGFDNPGRAYYYDPGEPAGPTPKRRTIYLGFSNEQDLQAVWRTLVQADGPDSASEP